MDWLIRGATVVTMDAGRRVLSADVRVRGDRIVQIGGKDVAKRPARVIDASGCVLMPGLVQVHVHLCQTLFRGSADELPLLAWLRKRIWPFEAAHTAETLRTSAELGIAEMLLSGTTTILDMGTVHEQDVIFEAMRDAGIRGFSGKAMMDAGRGLPRRLRETTRDSLRESERLCRTWHDACDGRLGYAFAPRFVLSCSEALLRGAAGSARHYGARLHSHVAEQIEERLAVRNLLGRSDLAALERCGIRGSDTVLAHGVHLTASEVRRIARAGTRVAHCPSANLKLASGLADVPAMRAAGVIVGLGSDGAACNNRLDPWTEMRLASLVAKVRTKNASALSAEEVLSMATIDGATVLGIDHQVGSLQEGKKADFIIVRLDGLHQAPDADVFSRLVYSTMASDVRDVFVDGKPLVRNRTLLTFDYAAVAESANRAMRDLLSRM